MKKSELFKLILDLQKRVADLEKAQKAPRYNPLDIIGPGRLPEVYIPSVWTVDVCVDGKEHTYPVVWHGTIPPACLVCGKQSQPTYTVTCSTNNLEDTAEVCCKQEDPCCSSGD